MTTPGTITPDDPDSHLDTPGDEPGDRRPGSGRPWEAVFSEEERETYRLYRRPARPELPWQDTALLVVDVTLAFLGERLPTVEAARRLRTACGLPAWEALGPTRRLIEAFRAAGRPVVYTKAFPESAVGGATVGASEAGDGNEIAPEIAPAPSDVVIEKARASAFFGTPLVSYLVRNGIRSVVVGGGTTSGCVRATVLDASALGFGVGIAADACFDRSPLSHAVALTELDAKYATVLAADEIVEHVRASVGPS